MCKSLPNNTVNFKLIAQIIKSADSIRANYIIEKLMILWTRKISRKKAKETKFWLHLIIEASPEFKEQIISLLNESIGLKKILSSIIISYNKKIV